MIDFGSPEELDRLLIDAYNSTLVAAKLFFPERFWRPFGPIHKEIAGLLDDETTQHIAIAAFRGVGKTSLVQLGYVGKKILFREKKFVVLVGSSSTNAEAQAESLKNELTNNPIIKSLFGNLKGAKWSTDRWIVRWKDGFETCILPKGAGQGVRGILFGNDRPDLIIGDDIEKDDEVLSEEQRKKRREWFYGSLCNCIDRGKSDWKIIYIDTVKHEDSLLERLLNDKKWTSLRLAIGNSKLETNWKEFMSTDKVRALYQEYKDRGEADVFYREYMNLPVSSEDKGFKSEHYRYADEGDELLKTKTHEGFVILDPAKTVNPKSANSSILGGSVDISNEKIFFRDLVNEKLHPDEIIDKCFEMCERMNSRILAVEVTSLNEFITYPIENEIRRRRLNILLVELKPRMSKEMRAKALIPFYRRGQIYHNKTAMIDLEMQQAGFPRPKLWDALDCAAYIVELMAAGDKYFGLYKGKDETREEIEKEFKELEYEYKEDGDLDDDGYDWAPGAELPSYV